MQPETGGRAAGMRGADDLCEHVQLINCAAALGTFHSADPSPGCNLYLSGDKAPFLIAVEGKMVGCYPYIAVIQAQAVGGDGDGPLAARHHIFKGYPFGDEQDDPVASLVAPDQRPFLDIFGHLTLAEFSGPCPDHCLKPGHVTIVVVGITAYEQPNRQTATGCCCHADAVAVGESERPQRQEPGCDRRDRAGAEPPDCRNVHASPNAR